MVEGPSATRGDEWKGGRIGLFLDGLLEAVIVLDRDLRVVHANSFARDVMGRTLSEVVGVSLWKLLPHLEDTPAAIEIPRAAASGVEARFSYFSSLTGRWLEARAFFVGEDLVFQTMDRSDERAADARLAATTDAIPAFIAYMDADLVYRFCNRRFEEWFGAPRREIIGKPMRQIVGEATFEQLRPYLERALSGERVTYAQWLNFARGRRFMRGTYVPAFDAEGRVEGLSAMIADETETREIEERLRQSEGHLSLAMAAGALGTWETDLETGETRYSGEAAKLFGRSEAEFRLSSEEWRAMIHPDDRKRIAPAFEALLARGAPYNVEFRAHVEREVWRWVQASGLAVRDPGGTPIRVIGIFSDVTARKEAEAEMERRVRERTVQLEAARRSQESWNYSVSHDLRAPLRAVVSTSRILQMEHADELSEEARALLARQAAAAKRLGDLIDELLQASRLASQDLLLVDLDLTAIAKSVASDLSDRLGKSFDVQVEEGMRGTGDSRLVTLVYSNYLENAMKYSVGGTRIEVGSLRTEDEAAFFVCDQGIGFDMQYEPKVWRPFERLVLESEYPGTGIGLYNVSQMVERMGGRVWAESTPGHGSTFWFTLGATS